MATSPDANTTNEVDQQYVYLEIEGANLTKNVTGLGFGHMHPFVQLELTPIDDDDVTSSVALSNCTGTHWDAHCHPSWSHSCPAIPLSDAWAMSFKFTVYNDNELHRYAMIGVPNAVGNTGALPAGLSGILTKVTGAKKIGQVAISMDNLIQESEKGGLLQMELQSDRGAIAGTLQVKAHVKKMKRSSTSIMGSALDLTAPSTGTAVNNNSNKVDQSWFVSPVIPLTTSGGTAAFFQLTLTQEGMDATKQNTPSFYVGKDLSHAQDEKDFYQQLLEIKQSMKDDDDEDIEDVGQLVPFMFDYLGILEAVSATTTSTGEGGKQQQHQVLVLQNLRNNFQSFRMLDLKIGEVTAQAGWKGKSRLHALKCHLLNDHFTNSVSEGYRLAGFDGTNEMFDSMDPLMDFLAGDAASAEEKKTIWGGHFDEAQVKKAKRLMINTLSGTDVLRFFLDVHTDKAFASDDNNNNMNEYLLPVEMVEMAFREMVSRLVQVAAACHHVQVPQKWIGSSVALGYDAGLLPKRSPEAEEAICSKVFVYLFDWGRSELLTCSKYHNLTPSEKADRQKFWTYYKAGIERLAFHAARVYYHQFTNTGRWTRLTLQVFDFDSTKINDHCGNVTIALPDPYKSDESAALDALRENREYKLEGCSKATARGSTLFCSITWLELPADSRILGLWRVAIDRATNVPVMDVTGSSDPFCLVIASETDGDGGRELHQRTCVKARNLNPQWNETIDVPVMRDTTPESPSDIHSATSLLLSAMALQGPHSQGQMARFFQWTDEERS
ncbi:expressed unknown protein [Seminavis robusta]|uniref:C2 domain-containing protein n=1 Tax=Seminavis robusta TaxID=568900 RepID=A0A9N8DQR4_9STRA|nr:expressed unknown protein [Seminavis robusta]|eukprot:Sro219_g090350.1 n/a (780) ;mRNA; r:20238-22577